MRRLAITGLGPEEKGVSGRVGQKCIIKLKSKILISIWLSVSLLFFMLVSGASRADDAPIPFWAKNNSISKMEYALAEKNTKLVEQLLRSGVDPKKVEDRFDTSIFLLSFRDREFETENLKIIRLLLSYNADVNYASKPDRCPPLYYIIGIGEPSSDKVRAVNFMLDFNASIAVEGRCQSSILHRAIVSKEYEISKLLIEKGHYLDDRELKDLSWIMDYEALKSILEVMAPKVLVRNAQTFFSSDNPLFVRYLIENNYLPERMEINGDRCFSPATYAALKRRSNILLELKSHGIDFSEGDCSGRDAYDYWPEIEKYLSRLRQGGR